MPRFSDISLKRLQTCHPDLQRVLRETIKHYDFAILCGFRDEEEQERCFHDGSSKLHWPASRHNSFPSRAVDVAPYPVDWDNTKEFFYLAGMMIGIATGLGVGLTWGGSWKTFVDLPHLELKNA